MSAERLLILPARMDRVVLVNPTKFLGNLLLAGGLMQRYALWCREQGIALTLVLDARYRDLARPAWPGVDIIEYPRHVLEPPHTLRAARAWWHCVRQIRRLGADLAFSLEEDSVAHALTRLSGARFRVGTSLQRSRLGLHAVLPIDRAGGVADGRHIWFSYHAVLTAMGLPRQTTPHYMRLPPLLLSTSMRQRLTALGVDFARPLAVLHAGATKAYKRWPLVHYLTLAKALKADGMQVLLIGVGASDRASNRHLAQRSDSVDLSDELSLAALIGLLREASLMVGNDSGPAHLAAALQVPGVVIFGPSRREVWQPLGTMTDVLSARHLCDPACRRGACLRDLACLRGIEPGTVMEALRRRGVLDDGKRMAGRSNN